MATDTPSPIPTAPMFERRLALLINILILLCLGWVGWQLSRRSLPPPPPLPAPPPRDPVSLDGATMLGSSSASMVLLEFSDFKCPFCRRFATDVLPALKSAFIDSGKVRLAFRQFPLPMHPGAKEAAEAAICAREQGRFWAMHDAFFAAASAAASKGGTTPTSEPAFEPEAASAQLNLRAFRACLGGAAAAQVDADVKAGQALGVTGTPTFFVGRVLPDGRAKLAVRIVGARPLSEFQQAIESGLGSSR